MYIQNLLLLLILASVTTSILGSNTTRDQEALLSFKYLLKDPLQALASWRSNSSGLDHCQWFGVSCDRRHGRVIALRLAAMNISGSISPHLSNLSFLSCLHLPNNSLHGYIPPELGLLRRLKYLNLGSNFLQGEIPSSLSHCSHLQTITLRNNMLHGQIPTNFSRLLELQNLSLGFNKLTGKLASGLALLPKLTNLLLRGNGLTGQLPPLLGSSSSLVYVELWNNSFSGNIPPFLANSSSLETLVLAKNSLTGSIPAELFNSSSLTYLDISNNLLSGGIPQLSSSISGLTYLSVSANNLTDGIPVEIGNLTSIAHLLLAENKLGGSIPETIGKLYNLERIDLTRTSMSGEIPSSIYNLSSLTYFNVGGNNLSGILPSTMGISFPYLQTLIMQDNQFTGPISVSLSNSSRLQFIDLAHNNFTGAVPPNLGFLGSLLELNLGWNQLQSNDIGFFNSLTNCSILRRLFLCENQLGGQLPTVLGNLSSHLEWLIIGQNKFTGNIPKEVGNLMNLSVLYLDHNLLSGNIPMAIGKLQNLHILYMSGNKLSGIIPYSFGNFTLLNELDLSSNELNGDIPPTLGNCKDLSWLNLSYNQLTGKIPKEIVKISSLTQLLDLSHNSLTGEIPAEISNLRNLVLLNVSENRLSGEIPTALGACQLLDHLNLEGNLLRGTIDEPFVNMKGLKELDLSRNNLSGQIPKFLSNYGSLQLLNLSSNDFEGEVPIGGVFDNASELFVYGNKKLCGGDSYLQLPPCPIQAIHKSQVSHVLRIIIPVCVAIIILSCLLCYLQRTKHTWRRKISCSELREKYPKVSYKALLKATDGFAMSNLIGTGSFGSVYKGKLENHQSLVAVKVLNLDHRGALESFAAECAALKSIRHRNLVKIITTCSSLDSKGNYFTALVYEFLPNGSLEAWMHPHRYNHNHSKELTLLQRLNIAINVASALEYLHHGLAPPLLHCDVKPSNVLLDENMNARISDFGLARFLQSSNSKGSIDSSSLASLKGSIGYVAPEYGMGSRASTKGDVYSFGILLLEMLTGKMPTDDEFSDALNLHQYVKEALPHRMVQIVDPTLLLHEASENQTDCTRLCELLLSLFQIGLSCSKEMPAERIEMNEAASKLRKIQDESFFFIILK